MKFKTYKYEEQSIRSLLFILHKGIGAVVSKETVMRLIDREFYRFIFWGGVNTIATYLLYGLLLLFLPYLISYSVAYMSGIFISYFLNSRFVFGQQLRLSKAVKYPLIYVTQYLIGVGTLYVLVQMLRANKLLAAAVAIVVSIPVTYLLSRRIVRGKTEVS